MKKIKGLFTKADDTKEELPDPLKVNEKQINKEEEKKKENAPKSETLCLMAKGDYTVHILLEEIKNIVPVVEGQPPSPRIKLTVFGKSERTSKTKDPCDNYVYNEHFYFDKTNLTVEMLDSEKIIIEVYDNNHSSRMDYFGIYEFDFGYIYNKPNHAMKNTWIGLNNPESDDISKVKGYLKLSISVLETKDARVELEPDDSDLSNCIIPAQIQMKYKQLSLHFFIGEEFPDMDSIYSERKTGRRCDGFIEVKYMGIKRKTKVVEMKNERVIWNQIVDIPATSPPVSSKICCTVYDEDIKKNDIVGSFELNVEDILNGVYNLPDFIDIYGSPLNKPGGVFQQMGMNAEIGSRWNGRILFKCTATDVDSPISRVRDIPPEVVMEANQRIKGNSWKIWIRLMSAYYLPKKEREYKIKISIQDKSVESQALKQYDSSIDLFETLELNYDSFSDKVGDLPDIFIYLVDNKNSNDVKNICFQRVKAREFYLKKEAIVIKLLPDPAIEKVDNMMLSGLLKCKILLYHKQNDINEIPTLEEFEKGGETGHLKSLLSGSFTFPGEESNTEMQEYCVVACVYMSKGLVAAESSGTSDPFVQMTCGDEVYPSSVKTNTMNGCWNEALIFRNIKMNYKDQTTWPIFLLGIFDNNKRKSEIPLSYSYIWLPTAEYSLNKTDLIKPKWHNLFLPKSNKQQGQILLSFYVFDRNNSSQIQNIKYKPEVVPYNCELTILGLRGLKPLGIIPVKKPFIKFDLNGLNVTGNPEDGLAPVQTVPVKGGENPTINTVIKFEAKLPKEEIFMPELQCEVYDHMLSGIRNSLLGVFSFNLQRMIEMTKKQMAEEMDKTRKSFGKGLGDQLALQQISDLGRKSYAGGNVKGMSEKSEDILVNSGRHTVEAGRDPLSAIAEVDAKKEEEKKEEKKKDAKIDTSNIDLGLDNMECYAFGNGEKLSSKSMVVDGKFFKENLNNSDYFVLYPMPKNFDIPGYKNPEEDNQGQNKNKVQKIQKDFKMEDLTKKPNPDLFMPVGYMLKAEYDIDPMDCPKHYRRIYRCPLETIMFPEFNLRSPFNMARVRRGKYKDVKSETNLFDAMCDIKGKIIYTYTEGGVAPPWEKKDSRQVDMKEWEKKMEERNLAIASGKSWRRETLSGGPMARSRPPQWAGMDMKSFGQFTGLIRIAEKEKFEEYDNFFKGFQGINGLQVKPTSKYYTLKDKLLKPIDIIVRVYILELRDLAKKDIGSDSDPYIKIYLDNKLVVNEQKNYQLDKSNCLWNKYYDIPAVIPGNSQLRIECWDYDDIFSDDLIGTTTISIEDRYLNGDWQELKFKPIEVRQFMHPDLKQPQGSVYMWLEMFESATKSMQKVWKIAPEPESLYEVRLVIWETEDMEMMDIEGTSDIYVVGYIQDQKKSQKTDIHYRCQTGNASFNWRMLLPLSLPEQKPLITLHVYDKDLFASDDFICGANINLKDLVVIPKYLKLPMNFTRKYYSGLSASEKATLGDIEFLSPSDDTDGIKFWVQCYKGQKDANAIGDKAGRVLCSLDILPKELADKEPLGKGREEPNAHPYCPPPTGRIKFSLNPFTMMNQLVGPKFRRKCYCYCVCCIILIYLVWALPSIVTGIIF